MKRKYPSQFIVRIIVFKEKGLFWAINLDMNVHGSGETIEEVKKDIENATIGHIKTVCDNNLDSELLFRPAEQKYWDMYNEHLEEAKMKSARRVLKKVKVAFDLPILENSLCQN